MKLEKHLGPKFMSTGCALVMALPVRMFWLTLWTKPLKWARFVFILVVEICGFVMNYNLRTSVFYFCLFISQRPFVNSSTKYHQVFIAGVDTLIWQSFASVIIPGITINRICALSLYTMKHTTKLPSKTRKWLTTAIGLACIPFIVKPIDIFVEFVMDETFRKAVGTGKY